MVDGKKGGRGEVDGNEKSGWNRDEKTRWKKVVGGGGRRWDKAYVEG